MLKINDNVLQKKQNEQYEGKSTWCKPIEKVSSFNRGFSIARMAKKLYRHFI